MAATNVSGTGPSSNARQRDAVDGARRPDQRHGGRRAPGQASGAAAVSWTAPASNGGAGISKYTVTSSTGSKTCTSTSTLPATPATTCTVTGLTNGTNYTFTVTATNASGTSAASVAGPVGGVVPSAVPATPSAPTVAVAGLNGQANDHLDRPEQRGLHPHPVHPDPDSGLLRLHRSDRDREPSDCVDHRGGLTNGTSYTFTLVATNGDGNSAASSASTAAVVGIPAAPTGSHDPVHQHLRAGLGQLDGRRPRPRAPITGYTLTPSPACSACTGLTVSGSPAATSTTVGGLTNGTSYTFTVKATNASGTSAASTASTGVVTGSPNRADQRGGGGRHPGSER